MVSTEFRRYLKETYDDNRDGKYCRAPRKTKPIPDSDVCISPKWDDCDQYHVQICSTFRRIRSFFTIAIFGVEDDAIDFGYKLAEVNYTEIAERFWRRTPTDLDKRIARGLIELRESYASHIAEAAEYEEDGVCAVGEQI